MMACKIKQTNAKECMLENIFKNLWLLISTGKSKHHLLKMLSRILQELRKCTQAEKIFSMNKNIVKHKILLCSFMSKNCISRYSVAF